ncbi:MAG: baseplate J/gp47 family protein [Oscillospiraceae bacterium]|jgi:uncharacterized phage protein gp47/JayE
MKTLPTAQEYYHIMSQHYRELTGLEAVDASDIGIRLRVLAQELHTLGERMSRAYADAFPQTAQGQALDLHAEAAGLIRLSPYCAAGILRFSRTLPGAAVTIPAGTLCLNREGTLRFRTKAEGTILQGETFVDIPAEALTAGPQGNVAAETVTVLLSALPGISAVRNPAPFTGGKPGESDEELRGRLLDALATPPDCANRAYYRAVATRHPGVRSVTLLPRHRGVGTLDVVVACAAGFEPAQVVAQLQEEYQKAREIGTQVLVRQAEALPVEVAALVVTASGYDPSQVALSCTAAISRYLSGLEIGQPLLVTRLSGSLLEVEGVENFRLLSPSGDVTPREDQIVVLGEVDIGKVASL